MKATRYFFLLDNLSIKQDNKGLVFDYLPIGYTLCY